MEELYQEVMMTCDLMGIPLEEGDYWFEAYVEFVREELNNRIKGRKPNRINTQDLMGIVMKGLTNQYGSSH